MRNESKTEPATELSRKHGTSLAEGERSMTDEMGKWIMWSCAIVYVVVSFLN